MAIKSETKTTGAKQDNKMEALKSAISQIEKTYGILSII
jgi:hypothetical protein